MVLNTPLNHKLSIYYYNTDVCKGPTQRARHVESTSIRRRYYVDTLKTKFRRIPRHFHELFQCNFADRKILVVSTYFFRSNFAGRKIHIVPTYSF